MGWGGGGEAVRVLLKQWHVEYGVCSPRYSLTLRFSGSVLKHLLLFQPLLTIDSNFLFGLLEYLFHNGLGSFFL